MENWLANTLTLELSQVTRFLTYRESLTIIQLILTWKKTSFLYRLCTAMQHFTNVK